MSLRNRTLHHLTDEEVEYEYNLCYETLNGVYIDGELIIEGLLSQNEDTHNSPETLIEAKSVWSRRLATAWEELMERALLS